jgi:hypothetical protein
VNAMTHEEKVIAAAWLALGRLRWYEPYPSERAWLVMFHSERPGVDLVAEIERCDAYVARRGLPNDPRAAVRGWLARGRDLPEAQRERYCSYGTCLGRARRSLGGVCVRHAGQLGGNAMADLYAGTGAGR